MIYTAIRILIACLFSMSPRSTVASSSATYDLCDVGKIAEENFTITLNLSENAMPSRLECSRVIFLQSKRVRLALEEISLDSDAVFEIHDGPYARQHIGPKNVTVSPSVYVSSGNAMFLRFKRSESGRGTSFIHGKITSELYQTTCHCRGVKNGQLECAETYGERKCEVQCQPSFMDLFSPKELRCDLLKGKWNNDIHNMSLSCRKVRSAQLVEVVVRFNYSYGTCQDFDLAKVQEPFLKYLTSNNDVKRKGVCFRTHGMDYNCSVKRLDVRCSNNTPPQITVTIKDHIAAPSNLEEGNAKFLDLFNLYSKGINLQSVADSEELRITEGNGTVVVDKSSFVVNNASPLCNDTLFYIKPHGILNYSICSSCPVHYVYNSTTQTCEECPLGSFAPEGAVSCKQGEDEERKIVPVKRRCSNKCMKGKQVDDKSWMCEWCPYDTYQTYSTMLDPKCASCPDKKKTPFPGAQDVKQCYDPCHSGTFLNKTSGQCQECQVGSYLEFEEHAFVTCKACSGGRTTLSPGSETENACIMLCGKGQFLNTSKGTCQECPKDTYQDQNHHNSTTCKPCGPNKITKRPGQFNVSQCQAAACQKGWFSYQSECKKCPKGFYQDQQGQDQCEPCPDGTSTVDEGQPDVSSCIRTCSRGEFLDAKSKSCNACPYGSYQEADSHLQTECNWCSTRETIVNEGAQNLSSCVEKCSHFPCQNGATCINVGDSLKCLCPEGVSGTFCEKNENIDKFHNIKMSLSFTSLSWSEELNDENSLKFRKTKNQIEGSIRYVFRYDPSFKGVRVTDFANGSVVANIDLYFNDDADYVPAKALQIAAHLGKVQNFSVLPDSLKILYQDCKQPLGIENNRVADDQMTGSTYFKNYEPYEGRLNAKGGRGWEAKYLRRQEYLQIDFEKQVNITAVATQGRPPGLFVTEYKLSFSDDAITWMDYTEGEQSKVTWTADSLTIFDNYTAHHEMVADYILPSLSKK